MHEDRRHPIRPLDPALIQRLFQGRRVESAERIPHGKSNSNYKVVVDGEAFVLRLHAPDRAARERACLRLAANVVPVPKLLDAGDDWSLMAFVEGDPLADHPECLQAATAMVTRLWTITFDARGWIGADGRVTPFDFGGESDFGTAMVKHPEVRRWLGEASVRALADLFARQAARVPEETPAGGRLVHGDFNPSNVLVRDGAVAAILDWEFAHSGDPFMDISNLVRNTPEAYHDDIRRGLESTGFALPEDWLARCEWDHLGSYLEFLTTERSDAFKHRCVAWIRGFLGRRARRPNIRPQITRPHKNLY